MTRPVAAPVFADPRRPSGPRPRFAGFTLIEILVVVVIIGIAAAVIVPQLGTRDDLKATAAARTLVADLIYAQNLSIARQRMHYVRFDPAAESYEVLSAISPTAARVTHPVEGSPFLVRFGPSGVHALRDVVVDAADFNGEVTIGFDEMGVPHVWSSTTGTASMTAGSVRLKCGVHVVTVTVEPFTGELKVN